MEGSQITEARLIHGIYVNDYLSDISDQSKFACAGFKGITNRRGYFERQLWSGVHSLMLLRNVNFP